MKINTKEKPLGYPVPFNVELETCPHCLDDLEQDYSLGMQMFTFQCKQCLCEDEDISMYLVKYHYNEHVGDIAEWTQDFSVGGLYVRTDLINEKSKLHKLTGFLLHDAIDIPFTILGVLNRDIIIKKFKLYSTFS